jgi:hypothetical protein
MIWLQGESIYSNVFPVKNLMEDVIETKHRRPAGLPRNRKCSGNPLSISLPL